jgi:hypothetical protein
VPIPDGWEYVEIDELERMCRTAEEFKRGRNSPPSSPTT